ncbi:von Willebrand factor D and EGF domain-containing protein-like isoform X1 [Lytechinus variegatus]|uniref:von Willebrand factor D and EGF domain-containing protein-like isoform X1 n=1 Tax=Lytechinus variegatus TaxID=7654 RepID=UPI001BB23B6A|nr:von Willebrand factor D and EGF domain-containing protein-like isoform X1 [Lytechinus variegatus]
MDNIVVVGVRRTSGFCQAVKPGLLAQRDIASTWKHALLLVLVLAGTVHNAVAQTECSPEEHRILDSPYRSVEYSASAMTIKLCDKSIERGWYRFTIYGKSAELPTECVQVNQCGTEAPIWLDTKGDSLPPPGESARHAACVSWTPSSTQSCCFFSFPVTVTNCGDFFVYLLQPARGCNMAYCAKEAREKCGPGELSPDGFEPCRESFPTILGLPEITPTHFEDKVQLRCSFRGLESREGSTKSYTVTWFKAGPDEMYHQLTTNDTFDNFASLELRKHFSLGDKVICTVQAFFNATRQLKSPPIESDPFHITISVSPKRLEIAEDGQRHLVAFESTVPIHCDDPEQSCSVLIPLSTISNDAEVGYDIALSECFVELRPRSCGTTETRCRQAFMFVTAVTDFQHDGRTSNEIITGDVVSSDPFWSGFNPNDLEVIVNDIPTAQCYSFTDPHFITFDRKKYDFYKTGTFVLYKSLRREFEVHTRIWNCGGISEQVSCNCGFVAKEDNDVISVDMCDGNVLETRAEVRVRSPQPLTDGVKIKQAKNGTKITVEFSSGAFIRADISDWGMSITVQAPSLDFNRTVGLCGTFDGNPDNEFHDKQGRDLDLAMRYGQANEFVELWRLRDGGMFNRIPLPVPYELRLPACSCLSPVVPPRGDLYPIQSLGCLGETSCRPRCTRFEDVYRKELVQSNDVTSVYSNIISNNPFGRRRKRSASDDRTKRQLNPPPSDTSLDQTALRDFFNLFDLDIPVGLFDDTGPVGPSVQSSYFFLPDHRPSDLRPLRATWPTPSGISYEQAREFCFQTVANTTLANACGESGLRTNMYIDDAVEMCLSDVQLTEDLTWASQTLPLVENQCEAAYVSNRTLWRPDISSGNELGEVVPPEGVLRALNCPNDCNGHGVCTKQGCICEDKYEPPDCSWKDDAIPYIVRLENNGLCDRETQRCDTVRITAREYREGKTITCLFSLSKDGINDVSSVIYAQSIAIRINRKTVLCNVPIIEGAANEDATMRWEVQVMYSDSSPSNTMTLIHYDSKCHICTWIGACTTKENACVIERRCYSAGQHNERDSCQQCRPLVSRHEWSISEDNVPPVLGVDTQFVTFTGRAFTHQLDAIDPDSTTGVGVEFSVQTQVSDDLYHVNISRFGHLYWLSNVEGDYTVPVRLTDECGSSVAFEMEVTVLACRCRNGGECLLDSRSGFPVNSRQYSCSCPSPYTGEYCDINMAPGTGSCTSNPCMHGQCQDSIHGFTCDCETGYTGLTCSIMKNVCDNNPCFEGVECTVRGLGSFSCGSCPENYYGDGITCKASKCKVPCPKNMICDPNVGCVCKDGYHGYACFRPMCNPPCLNNGRCVQPNTCACPVGYTGQYCQRGQCSPVCQNNGRCMSHNRCHCWPGFTGSRCEIMSCNVNCMNGGYCVTPDRCICRGGYSGPACQTPVCSPMCRNGGRCVSPGLCVCPRGFQGQYCQRAMCSLPCRNGGVCVRKDMCSCPRGYTGRMCERAICEPRCQNGGRCVSPGWCSCPSGYRGRKCHKAICPSGCRNGGECVEPNVCMCIAGYGGSSCENPICNKPCMYGGKCIKPDTCLCRRGYKGKQCENNRLPHRRYRRDEEDVL